MLVPLFAVAAALAAEPAIPYTKYALSNGLQVILSEDHSVPFVWVDVWYEVGSKDEAPGLSGFAHLFEHLMFQGSQAFDDDYFKALQPIGAQVNGNTTTDRTNYFEGVPSEQLPRALFLEADRMGTLADVLTAGKLDNQRDVVRNERRQNYENRPYGLGWPTLLDAMYPEGHPYHIATIGKHEDLQRASLADVTAFFRTWYVPNNATLVVCGDFEAREARAMVDAWFGPLAPRELPTRPPVAPVVLEREKRVVATDRVPVDRVWVAWHTPATLQAGDAELDLLSEVLTGGLDARLTRALVHDRRIAQSVSAGQQSMRLGSMFLVDATASAGHTGDELVAAIDEELAKVRAEGVTPADVAVAQTAYEVGFWHQLTTIQGKARSLAQYNALTGDPGYGPTDLARYRAATADSVNTALRTWLPADRRVVLRIGPEAK